MTKAKTNALESLRALIAERQQYENWITTLESKRDGTPVHVFERVHGDYNARLERVMSDIKGHAEELQLSISALSSRLVEVAREEDARRDALQEGELRATVGEYEPQQWEQLKSEAEQALQKIAADRASLDNQLTELRSIQRLSEVGSIGSVADVELDAPGFASAPSLAPAKPLDGQGLAMVEEGVAPSMSGMNAPSAPETRDQGHLPLEQVAAAASAAVLSSPPPVPIGQATAAPSSSTESSTAASTPPRPRNGKTPPFGGAAVKPKAPESRTDQAKTLKCPECGTANYPTEWYCERCGGELATM